MKIYKAIELYEDGIISEFILGTEVLRSEINRELSPEEYQALYNVFGACEEQRVHNPLGGEIVDGQIQLGINTNDWNLYQNIRIKAGLIGKE